MGAGAEVPLLGHDEPRRGKPAPESPGERTLTVLPLASLIFFEVSGGPFGVEDAVGAAGPFWALLGFLAFPLVWSVPEALVTAELTGIFPENAGYVAWVTEAFGPCLGFVEGWCSWWSGAIDNAIYPGLFLQYLKQLAGGPGDWLDARNHFLAALLAVNVVLTYINWRGLDVVSKVAMVLGLLAISPFFAMTVLAIPQLDLAQLASRKAHPDWRLLLNTLMWNLNCESLCNQLWQPATVQTAYSCHSTYCQCADWDSASTLSGEVVRPGSTIPRALAVTVIIVVLTYTVPIIIGCAHVIGDDGSGSDGSGGTGSGSTSSLALRVTSNTNYASDTDHQWSNWRDGYFTTVAEEIGGRWLGVWLIAAAALSTMGQYLSEMSSNSFQLEGMAQRRQLPRALRFGHRSRHGTSTTGIFASFFICVLMGAVELDMVIEATNCLYCVSALLEFAAFLRLRCVADSPARTTTYTIANDAGAHSGGTAVGERFVIPLSTIGCALMLLPAAVSIVLVRICTRIYTTHCFVLCVWA
eukprot:COSAG02_NODE_3037_length_7501_cov_5.769116_7_plen_526_part_00